ncbi:hypothetical protein BC833DRAFT_518942, partial [Globomyces pollinis-pini]
MAEITPTLPNRQIIRTYPNDYAPSDTESEGEVQFEAAFEEEEEHSVHTRLLQNQQYMDEQITPLSGERTMWVLEPQLRQPIE